MEPLQTPRGLNPLQGPATPLARDTPSDGTPMDGGATLHQTPCGAQVVLQHQWSDLSCPNSVSAAPQLPSSTRSLKGQSPTRPTPLILPGFNRAAWEPTPTKPRLLHNNLQFKCKIKIISPMFPNLAAFYNPVNTRLFCHLLHPLVVHHLPWCTKLMLKNEAMPIVV